jgi:hypothetical protein
MSWINREQRSPGNWSFGVMTVNADGIMSGLRLYQGRKALMNEEMEKVVAEKVKREMEKLIAHCYKHSYSRQGGTHNMKVIPLFRIETYMKDKYNLEV